MGLWTADPSKVTPEDIARVAAQIAALLDPTGVSGVISAYTYPLCSNLNFGDSSTPQSDL